MMVVSTWEGLCREAGPDPGFPIGGGTSLRAMECQHTNFPDFPQNCMILRKFWSMGGGVCVWSAPLDLTLEGVC